MSARKIERIVNPEKNKNSILKRLIKIDSLLTQANSYSRINRWLKFKSDKQELIKLQELIKKSKEQIELLLHRIRHMHG